MLGRWIVLFPPGSDQNVTVLLNVLRYLFKIFANHQSVGSLHSSLFVCVLKLLETDSFSLCLHAKIDEILSLVFLILAHGSTDEHTTFLDHICSVSTLWITQKNFIDSLMKHHHSSIVLGLAVQTGLTDTILRNVSELVECSPQCSVKKSIALTSLWLSFLNPFSHHIWVKYICSEDSQDFQKNTMMTTLSEPTIVHMEGSNKLLRQLQFPNNSSIDNWCLINCYLLPPALVPTIVGILSPDDYKELSNDSSAISSWKFFIIRPPFAGKEHLAEGRFVRRQSPRSRLGHPQRHVSKIRCI